MTSIKLALLMAFLAVGFSVQLRTSSRQTQYVIDESVPEENLAQLDTYACGTEDRAPGICPTYTVQGCYCTNSYVCTSQGVNKCRDCQNLDTYVVAEGISCAVLLGKEEVNNNGTAAETTEEPKPVEEVPEVKQEEEVPEVVVPVVPAEEEVPEVVVPVVPQEEEVPEVVVPVVPAEEEVPEVVVPVVEKEEEVPEVVVPVVPVEPVEEEAKEEEAPEVVVPVVPVEPVEEEAKEEEAAEVVVPVVPVEEEAKEEEAPEVVVPVVPTEEEEAHEEESAEQPAEEESAEQPTEEEAAEQPTTEEEAAEKPAAEDKETAEQPDINDGGESAGGDDDNNSVHPVPSRNNFIVIDPFTNYTKVPVSNLPSSKVCSAAEKALPQQICLLAPIQACVCTIFGCQDQLVDVCNVCRQAGVVSYNLETKCSGKLTVNGDGVYNCVAIDRLFANAAGYCDSNCKSTSCVCYQNGHCETKVTNKCEACSNGDVVAVQEGSVCNIRN